MNLNQQYLQAMGVEVWQERNTMENTVSTNDDVWRELQEQVKKCALCGLEKTRTQTVFGAGNQRADLLVIGEAPGANEDRQGEPFVGRAGMLLNAMLHAIGLDRKDIYIANILKCRPPNNRDPLPREVGLCTPYLKKQIELIKPKLIVTVGRIAAQFLLNTDESMGRLRGKVFEYEGIPVIATYHPAYLLRSPRGKAKSYQDFLRVKESLGS
ncbi:MAG: uracil-DNA glycosylase [Gammaproteobacteria bacterium]|jgi:DNA polymerase